MREGVEEFIKKLSTEEDFEKVMGTKVFVQQDKEPSLEDIESLISAKASFLKQQQEQTTDPEQKQHLEATLQRYLEAARQTHHSQIVPIKIQNEQNKMILNLA